MKKLKKALAITVLSMSITSSMGIVTWADTTNGIISQTDRWEGTGDSWKLLNESRNGYVVNSWFQDLDGSWYMLGSDGTMFSGLVTDQSTGKSYLLNTNHDGTYGRMLTTNGTYTVNGKSVYLTFDQSHNGTYGAILSGLSEARSSGAKEVSLPSIPTDSSSSSYVSSVNNNTTSTPESQPTIDNNNENNSGADSEEVPNPKFHFGGDLTGGGSNIGVSDNFGGSN